MHDATTAAGAGGPAPRDVAPLRAGALAALALGVLVVGAAVYVVDRPAGLLRAVAAAIGTDTHAHAPRAFGTVGDWLPSFAHAFAFGTWLALAFADRWATRWRVCAGWTLAEIALEAAQSVAATPRGGAWLDALHARWPALEPVHRFLAHGTFDPRDLVAAAVGGACAVALLRTCPPARAVRATPPRSRVVR